MRANNKTMQWLLTGGLLVVALVLPHVVYPLFLMKMLCFMLFAAAFNLLLGYTGLLSFGHAAFLGGAGYITGLVMTRMQMDPLLGILTGTAFAAALGLVMGMVAIRRQGIYFSMITLALAQMFYFYCLQAKFTGGEDGLQGIPRGTLLGALPLQNDMTMYYFVLALVVAAFALIYRTIHSPYGQVMKAIKDNEPRTISLGYQTQHFKLIAFVLSATLAGLAGATKSVVLGFATLTDVYWATSGLVILMTLIGGMSTFWGPMLGAAIVVMLENRLGNIGRALASATGVPWFHKLGEEVNLVIGFIFVLCVMLFRKGIVGEWLAWRDKRRAS
ncbi:MAG: branched-chain amino acid ABC transporter permease [Brachymonas sp.]|nr:branched-chain amino acid ABC transporter permease [Brachymonas sp.]